MKKSDEKGVGNIHSFFLLDQKLTSQRASVNKMKQQAACARFLFSPPNGLKEADLKGTDLI